MKKTYTSILKVLLRPYGLTLETIPDETKDMMLMVIGEWFPLDLDAPRDAEHVAEWRRFAVEHPHTVPRFIDRYGIEWRGLKGFFHDIVMRHLDIESAIYMTISRRV